MSAKRPTQCGKKAKSGSVVVRLDQDSKDLLKKAAALQGKSMSAYVRSIALAEARRDIEGGGPYVFRMSPEDQLAFWNALNATPVLTEAERELGAMMRGEK